MSRRVGTIIPVIAICLLVLLGHACSAIPKAYGARRITPQGETWAYIQGISWSPQGDEIALARTISQGEGMRVGPPEGYIYIQNIAEDKPKLLQSTFTGMGQVLSPDWSPDSTEIAFFTSGTEWVPNGIWSVNAREHEPPDFLGEGESCAWSPSGDKIAIAEAGTDYHIYILDAHSGERKEIYQSPTGMQDRRMIEGGISWSRQGDRIAFAYGPAGGSTEGTITLYEYSLMSGGSRILLDGGFYRYPSWSPDGTMLVFSGGVDLSSRSLWILRVDDGQMVRPIGLTDIGAVSWSPDGKDIAFVWKGSAYAIKVENMLRDWNIGE